MSGAGSLTDIALAWAPLDACADMAINATGTDLLADDGLYTAVVLSLFSDRLAQEDDVIPDGTANRRGWCGDDPAAGADRTGSRLWLLSRCIATVATQAAAEEYVREALQWLLDDGIAQRIDVTCRWTTEIGRLRIRAVIIRQIAGQSVTHAYDFAWSNTVSGS